MSNQGAAPDPNYQAKARALWDLGIDRLRFTSQVNADYGKWLIVTITSVHLAALYLVSQPSVPADVRANVWSYWPFVAGLCSALVAGLIVWINWGMAANIFISWLDPKMLFDAAFWPKKISRRREIVFRLTYWLPIVFGIFSAVCVPWGAYEILHRPTPLASRSEPKLIPTKTLTNPPTRGSGKTQSVISPRPKKPSP